MANSIIKWCKNKFLNGYKHINVEASEDMSGNRSDTETLVRTSEKEFLLTARPISAMGGASESAMTSPNKRWSPDHQDTKSMATYLEEVTCDLSLTGGETPERQEFSFTLYDFDGHGRVTKDDIAGLVQTIYETVGSSLSLPPCGSRTIRVKLSVAPEVTPPGLCLTNLPKDSPRSTGTNEDSSKGSDHQRTSPRTNEQFSPRTNEQFSPRTNEQFSPRTNEQFSPRTNEQFSPRTNEQFSPRTNEQFSPRTDLDDQSSPRIVNDFSTSPEESPRLLLNESPRRNEDLFCNNRGDYSSSRRDSRRRRRKRSNFHRQELLEIIQANMEKNNLFYPPLNLHKQHNHRRRRKNCSHCCTNYSSTPDPALLKARLMKECSDHSCHCSAPQGVANQVPPLDRLPCPKDVINTCIRHCRSKSQDYNTDSPHVFRHHLLEDSSVAPHQEHPLPPSNTPDRPISPRVAASNNSTNQHHHEHHHVYHPTYQHLRSRSCEGTDNNREKNDRLLVTFGGDKKQEKNNNNNENFTSPSQGVKKAPLGKLKYRQDEHNRAMSQVVAWLDRSSFKDGTKRGPTTIINTLPPPLTTQQITTDSNNHHVHEHFHHHYHHYTNSNNDTTAAAAPPPLII